MLSLVRWLAQRFECLCVCVSHSCFCGALQKDIVRVKDKDGVWVPLTVRQELQAKETTHKPSTIRILGVFSALRCCVLAAF